MVLVGVADGDTARDSVALADKVVNLRIFADSAGKLNLSLLDCGGQLLAVSQFTLLGDCRRGRRPSFTAAAAPALGVALFDQFVEACRAKGVSTQTGRFGADMAVDLVNDGPVTLILDSKAGPAE
jgi:D-tyrosyl-tRNA(Tyr) deacylase